MVIVNGKRKVINVYKKSLLPETLAWQSWVVARGGSVDPVILKKMNDYFFKPAIAAGNILNKMHRICIYQGTGNTIAATTNLISDTHHATQVNGPTWTNANGFSTPTGTGYLNWHLNPTGLGGSWLTDNLTGVYIKNASFAATYKSFGNRDTGGRYAQTRGTGGVTTIYANGAAVNNSLAFSPTGIKKYYFGSKFTSVQQAYNITPAGPTTATQTPTAWQNRSFFELTHNNNGSPDGNYDPSPHVLSFLASNSVNLAALETILDNLLIQL